MSRQSLWIRNLVTLHRWFNHKIHQLHYKYDWLPSVNGCPLSSDNLYWFFYDRMAKWRSYFKHAVNVHLACWPPFRKPCLHLLPLRLPLVLLISKSNALVRKLQRWKHLDQLLISALIGTLTENKMTVKVYLTPDVKTKLILVKIMPC
jgi:hypothetical protein